LSLKILQIVAEDHHGSHNEMEIIWEKVSDHDGDPFDGAN
jgi:hypothetical protein